MAGTKDFIIDLTTKLEKQGYSYLLVTLTKNKKKENNVDIFFDLKNTDAAMVMAEALDEIQNNLIEKIEENFHDEECDDCKAEKLVQEEMDGI